MWTENNNYLQNNHHDGDFAIVSSKLKITTDKAMKNHLINHYGAFLFGILFFFLTAFIPEKYSPEFKKVKKGVDTLTLINPVVQIVAKSFETEYTNLTLATENQKLIDSVTTHLLSKKYKLERAITPSTNIINFSDLFNQLENSSKSLNKASSKQIFNKQITYCKSRYALLLVYMGQINPDFPPHYKLNTAVFSNTIVITPNNPTKAISDLRALIIDTEQEEIVYYDRLTTSKYDARTSGEVAQITKDLLKKIYYK